MSDKSKFYINDIDFELDHMGIKLKVSIDALADIELHYRHDSWGALPDLIVPSGTQLPVSIPLEELRRHADMYLESIATLAKRAAKGKPRSRTAVTDQRLAEFAACYDEHVGDGGMAAVARSLGLGERQAWRLKKRASEQGVLH